MASRETKRRRLKSTGNGRVTVWPHPSSPSSPVVHPCDLSTPPAQSSHPWASTADPPGGAPLRWIERDEVEKREGEKETQSRKRGESK